MPTLPTTPTTSYKIGDDPNAYSSNSGGHISTHITTTPEKRGLKAKIIGFTTFQDGQDKECIAITDDGKEVTVDPFVGCSWDYDKREHLLNQWFEDTGAWQHEKDGVWLTGDNFRLLGDKNISTELRNQATELLGEVEKMIGEDEDPYKGIEMVSVVKTRNEHRQELRTKLASLRSKWERK